MYVKSGVLCSSCGMSVTDYILYLFVMDYGFCFVTYIWTGLTSYGLSL